MRSPMIHPLNLIQLIAIERKNYPLLRKTVTGVACGMLTTGGTESIIAAMKTIRVAVVAARGEPLPWQPYAVIAGVTAHPAVRAVSHLK